MTTPLKARMVFIRSVECLVSSERNPEGSSTFPVNKLLNFRMVRSPSPQPSPQGEGVTLPRYWVETTRILEGLAKVLPLLGERAGVRGNGTSNIPPPSALSPKLRLRR